ncbi:hypothetical protein BCR44DRAFT_1296592 [Catenaria anguillulae PL171]|uniref:Uncharacterized protein n=1 Tax=Catenaria anguillulae PL171 TaxID=765915 RepID=A0A1Y2HY39_9FUNG|nr:hypothetical protein BCR44DRAFT_1296592 [Catenaria anguillulae PL171]
MPTSTAHMSATRASGTPMEQKQRVVVLLPSTVDLARLDFIQVTDAACHALGQNVDLSDLVLTIAQTPLVTVRDSAVLGKVRHECSKCGQRQESVTAEEEKAVQADVDAGAASVAVEPPTSEVHLAEESVPVVRGTVANAEIPTLAEPVPPGVKEAKKTQASPTNKSSDITFDSVLSRLSTQQAPVPSTRQDAKASTQSKPKSPNSSLSHSHVKLQLATSSKPTQIPPVPPSTLAYLDPRSPIGSTTKAINPTSCLLFPADQSNLVANVAQEEEQKLKEMEELDPVDVNYFLRLLQGSADPAASGNAGPKNKKNDKAAQPEEDVFSVASGGTGMDVVDKLRFKFMEALGEDSDDDGGFGPSDDDDLSM